MSLNSCFLELSKQFPWDPEMISNHAMVFESMKFFCILKWDATWENVYIPSDMSALRRLKSACASNQIRVFVVSMKKLCIPGYPKCTQWRFWSDCAFAQSDPNLRWAQMSKELFLAFRLLSVIVVKQSMNGQFFLAQPNPWGSGYTWDGDSAIFYKGDNFFMVSCLLSCTRSPFWKDVYPKRK